ncbi:MAG: AMP-binding protein [Deltaproteobacteria bacterium]|nr:AMP-binding protein [Deltaproteobacteria bacterium]
MSLRLPEASAERLDRSLPGRLAAQVRAHPDAVALREKRLGIWRERSWKDYWDGVRAVAHGLADLGVKPGDHVAILSDNRVEWVLTDLAVQGLGARSVGVYQTDPADAVAYVLSHSETVLIVCEDQEQVDKVVEVRGQTPTVKHVVVLEPQGTRRYEDERLIAWDALLERGERLREAEPDFFARQVAALEPETPSMVVYTSGTTGRPKGALLSSANVCAVADAAQACFGLKTGETMLSYLPLCHVAEKIFTLFLPLKTGGVVHFGESIDTVTSDLREVSPTVFLGVPRIWEKMAAAIEIKIRDTTFLKRTLFNFFAARGRRIAARRREGALTLLDRLVWFVGDLMVYRPLQERLGLRRCSYPISGAAPISDTLLGWYHGLGVAILEGYGQTEDSGVTHVNPPGRARLGTVGPPLPGVEVKLAGDGELCVRGPTVFLGYLHNEEATREAIDAEGWLHTGDVATEDAAGFHAITGRIKEIIVTSGGKNLSPERIENALKVSPYIKEAIAIGDGRKFVSALVQIELDAVGDWATRQRIAYTSFEDLTRKSEVIALVQEEIDRANELLARVESVRAFRLLPAPLNQDEGEITATQKVKRRVIHERYAPLIESMYGGGAG